MSKSPRAGSATKENRAFRQAITSMRQEMLESQAETQRIKDQLNCLIMLVKRAWAGDEAAAIHVANIVGAAPPTFLQEADCQQLTALHKPKSIHHWAMLTVGLLSRHYRELGEHALTLAKRRLHQRQEFLDDQLRHHQEMLENPRTVPLQHHEHTGLQKPGFFLTSGTSSATEPGKTTTLSSMTQHMYCAEKPKLFEIPAELSNKPKIKRPMSGQQMKKADAARARPRSAVVRTAVKTERPLKYETTRPTSAKTRAKSSPSKPSNLSMSKQQAMGKSQQKDYSLDLKKDADNESGEAWERTGHMSMEDSVCEELRKIEQMEEDFEKTTKLLQMKLGISGKGAI